ncbi:MAG: hypothetical protein J6A15_09420 [Clostridia bacterium]|nr:hypothetical protein [Clostridia bacterium]
MNNFNFYVLGNYSPNIRTFGKYKSTCYRLMGFSKEIFLDFGAGIFFKFLRIVKKEEIDLNNVMIIISHNHIDHNLSLLSLVIYLYFYNKRHEKKKKVHVILPHRSIIYTFISSLKSVFDVETLNESTAFSVDNCEFTFCKTIHKGESYATKIKLKNHTFVYTSDIAKVSDELEKFIDGADTVLVDAGYPNKLLHSFRNYHGITSEILQKISSLNIKKILATHIRFFAKYSDYLKSIPKKANVKIVQIDDSYKMFK